MAKLTGNGPTRTAGITLTEEQLQALDRVIAVRMLRGQGRISRSELLREIVAKAMPKLLAEVGDVEDVSNG